MPKVGRNQSGRHLASLRPMPHLPSQITLRDFATDGDAFAAFAAFDVFVVSAAALGRFQD